MVPFSITHSLELAATCLTLLARDRIATLTDMAYTPRDLLGPGPHTAFTISQKSPPFVETTSTIDPAVSTKCRSFACARASAEGSELWHSGRYGSDDAVNPALQSWVWVEASRPPAMRSIQSR